MGWHDSILRACSEEQQAVPSVRLLCHRRLRLHLTEDSMDMDMSPLRPQNNFYGCELKADKDDHFKLLSMPGKRSAPGGCNKIPEKKLKLDEDDDEDDEDDEDDDDDDFDDEEAEEKVPVKKSV
ncbi:Nucleophosmin [Microtus ochrogaster]|uniref:Nucleophosmin n=1 Tax=Microtus ochrogaster TaxID=79684 RepID=A0A8J6G4B7_MICOH|nr:Nucleophosmin [Microtus ochrogaster]